MTNKINWNKFLFRSSGVYNIMSGTVGATATELEELDELLLKEKTVIGLTDKQEEELKDLKAKEKLTDNQKKKIADYEDRKTRKKELTPKQEERKKELLLKKKDETLPKGVQTYLKKLYREETYNRRKRLESKYILKGNLQEEEAITMYSMYINHPFSNNKERAYNEYISGEYDMYIGKDIYNVDEGFDTKCSFDLSTFPFPDDVLDWNYYWQNMSYMWLSGAKKWTTVYCLTNTPSSMIEDMIYREKFKWEGNEIPLWKKLEIINNNTFDDKTFASEMMKQDAAPSLDSETEDNLKAVDVVNNFVPMELKERVIEKVVHFDESIPKRIIERVKLCRKFLVTLSKQNDTN
jgi:hypothetical protein